MQIWQKSDRGKVREINQDYVCSSLYRGDLQGIAVLCDGMGGAKAGNVASEMAADCIHGELSKAMKGHLNEEKIKKTLAETIRKANQLVFDTSCKIPDYSGMGTTVVALVCDGNRGYLASVGDSRAYLINEDGVRQLTTDHSLVEEMLRRGELSREEAKSFPAKNYITRAVGTEPDVECDLCTFELYQDDYILICSDGLSNLLDEQEILYEVNNVENTENCCERLINIALERGAPDNVSVILLKI